MPLQKQVITVPIGGIGMDSSKDPKIHQGVTQVINGNFDTDGIIAKREGEFSITKDSDAYSHGNYLATHRDGLLVWDQDGYKYDGTNVTKLSNTIGACDVQRDEINNTYRSLVHYTDYAETGDIYAVTYVTADTIDASADDEYNCRIEVYNKSTNEKLSELSVDAVADITVLRPAKLLTISATQIQYFYLNSGGVPVSGYINSPAGTIQGPFNIVGYSNLGRAESYNHDVCIVEKPSDAYAVWAYPDANGDASILSIPVGTITTAHDQTYKGGSGFVLHCAVWPQTNTSFCLATGEHTTPNLKNIFTKAFELDLDTGFKSDVGSGVWTASIQDLYSLSGVRLGPTTARTYATRVATNSGRPTVYSSQYNFNGSVTSNPFEDQWIQNGALVVKPETTHDGYSHVMGVYHRSWGQGPRTAQDQLVWYNEDGYAIGRSLVGIARYDEYGFDSYGVLAHLDKIDEYNLATTANYVSRVSLDDTQTEDQFQLARLSLDLAPDALGFAEKEEVTVLANSCPYEVDGVRVVEAGFHMYPEPITGSPGSGLGAMENNGTYKYVAVFEEVDANGKLHRSSPTPTPLEITMGASDNGVTLQLPTLATRRDNVFIALYRTIDGGTEYYRVASYKNNTYKLTLPQVQVVDGLADALITDNEPLYTDSGEIENIAPLPHRISTIWQNRHVYVDRDNEATRIRYSKEFAAGQAVLYTDLFTINVDPDGGAITALFPFSNKLIIFKSNKIYATAGVGRNSLAGGTNFSRPWVVSPSIGCIDQRSIARVPDGVIFQSERGLWLLTQNERISPIGEPVQQKMYTQTVVGAGNIPNRHEAHFITSDGYSASYNWLKDRWSLISSRTGTQGVSKNNVMYWLDGAGNIEETKQDKYLTDNDEFYSLRVDTGWFSFAKIGGHKRIYKVIVIGQNLENHKLRVKVAYDFDPYWTDDLQYDTTAISEFDLSKYYDAGVGSSSEDKSYIVEIPTSRQKCSSIRISVEDLAPDMISTGQGVAFTAVAFEVGVKAGSKPIGDNRTQGS